MLTTGTLILIAYSVLLWHTLNGNKNKFLLTLIYLLIASQVGLIMYGYGFLKVNGELVYTKFNIWILGGGAGLYYSTYSLSHYLFAENYRLCASRIPLKMQGLE